MAEREYDAFISYSHSERSTRIAESLQAELQRFARPWYRSRARRIFRDTTNLAVSPELWANIEAAMDRSDRFILLASPQAAASKWVEREVMWWLTNRTAETLLLVLVEGQLIWNQETRNFALPDSTAMPRCLAVAYESEPLWANLTHEGDDGAPYSEAAMDLAVAQVAAGVAGVSLDAMRGEHLRQRRVIRTTVALIVTTLLLLAGTATAGFVTASRERDAAVRSADIAASRSLVVQSENLRGVQTDRALLAGVAAHALDPGQRGRTALIRTLVGSRYAGTLPGPVDPVHATEFAPTGTLAVTTHLSGKVHIWDLSDPTRAALLSTIDTGVPGQVPAAIRPDGRVLALGGNDGRLVLWDVSRPREPHESARLTGHTGPLWTVSFSADGDMLYSGGESLPGTISDGEGVRFWDVRQPGHARQLGFVPVQGGITIDIAADPRTSTVAIAGVWGVRFWTADGSRMVGAIDPDAIYGVAWPDGRTLLTCGPDVRLWELGGAAPQERAKVDGFPTPVVTCDLDRGGRRLALGQGNGVLSMWTIDGQTTPTRLVDLPGHTDLVDSVSWSADGSMLLSGSADGRALLWHAADPTAPVRQQARETAATPYPRNEVSVSPDGRTLLVMNYRADGASLLIDATYPRVPRELTTIETPALHVNEVAWSADGTRVLLAGKLARSGAGAGTATLWDISDRSSPRELTPLGFGDQEVTSAALTADASLAALAVNSRTVQFWSLTEPDDPHLVPGPKVAHTGLVSDLALSPRGDVLATASADQTVALWPISGASRLGVLPSLQAPETVIFTPDATQLVVLERGGSVSIWDVDDPTQPIRLGGIPAGTPIATSMTLDPGNRTLRLGSDGREEIWDIGRLRDMSTDPVAAACARTGRGLTEDEWQSFVPERPYRPTC